MRIPIDIGQNVTRHSRTIIANGNFIVWITAILVADGLGQITMAAI